MASTFIEFHILRSHAPGNMNRDDAGTPKTALFGGHRRLRISSQCLKRTWRTSEHFRSVLGASERGTRTKKLSDLVKQRLVDDGIEAPVLEGFDALLQQVGRATTQEGAEGESATAHLLFLSDSEITAVAEFVRKNKSALAGIATATAAVRADRERARKAQEEAQKAEAEATPPAKAGGRSARPRGANKSAPKASEEITAKLDATTTALREVFTKHMKEAKPRTAADIALFGRFLTSDEFKTVDAALQVAHALGTQKVEIEYDYYSAVDDEGDAPGAGHIGETEFAASVLYEYAVCTYDDLITRLQGDKALADKALRAVLNAAARSVPKGKVNGTAPQNPADYVEVVVRTDAPISLANAFLKPVTPTAAEDVMQLSIERLAQFRGRYEAAYSEPRHVLARFVLDLSRLATNDEDPLRCKSLKALDERLTAALSALTHIPATPS